MTLEQVQRLDLHVSRFLAVTIRWTLMIGWCAMAWRMALYVAVGR